MKEFVDGLAFVFSSGEVQGDGDGLWVYSDVTGGVEYIGKNFFGFEGAAQITGQVEGQVAFGVGTGDADGVDYGFVMWVVESQLTR